MTENGVEKEAFNYFLIIQAVFFFQDTWQCNYGRRNRPSTQGSTGKRHTGF